MFLGQLRYGFDFYDDLTIAEKVRYVGFLDGNAFVAYSQLLFCVEWYAAMIEFPFEALLIYLFLESAAHLVVDFIDCSANCVAFVWVYQSLVHRATIIAKKLPDIRAAP